jgi:hypothetical protein
MEPVAPQTHRPIRRAISATAIVGGLLTIPVWIMAFPPAATIDPFELALRTATLFVGLIGYACFVRFGARTLEAGWFLFAYSALLELLREFTAESLSWERWPILVSRTAALLLIGIGGIRFAARRPRGRAHLPPPSVLRPGPTDLHAERGDRGGDRGAPQDR